MFGKWLLALFKYYVFCPLQTLGGLPEGVSEVHTPPFQLLWVVWCHVGKFPEDVKVCGVTWWRKKKEKKKINDENDKGMLFVHFNLKMRGRGNWHDPFIYSQNICYIWNEGKNRKQRVRKPRKWRGKNRLRHHEASLFQLYKFWGFTFLVAMATAESTDITKAVQLLCVPWELPGSAN